MVHTWGRVYTDAGDIRSATEPTLKILKMESSADTAAMLYTVWGVADERVVKY